MIVFCQNTRKQTDSNPFLDLEGQMGNEPPIPTDMPDDVETRQRPMLSTGRDASGQLTHSLDLGTQNPHCVTKSRGFSIAKRYYKVITCAIGITLVLVTLLGCGIGTHQDRRRLPAIDLWNSITSAVGVGLGALVEIAQVVLAPEDEFPWRKEADWEQHNPDLDAQLRLYEKRQDDESSSDEKEPDKSSRQKAMVVRVQTDALTKYYARFQANVVEFERRDERSGVVIHYQGSAENEWLPINDERLVSRMQQWKCRSCRYPNKGERSQCWKPGCEGTRPSTVLRTGDFVTLAGYKNKCVIGKLVKRVNPKSEYWKTRETLAQLEEELNLKVVAVKKSDDLRRLPTEKRLPKVERTCIHERIKYLDDEIKHRICCEDCQGKGRKYINEQLDQCGLCDGTGNVEGFIVQVYGEEGTRAFSPANLKSVKDFILDQGIEIDERIEAFHIKTRKWCSATYVGADPCNRGLRGEMVGVIYDHSPTFEIVGTYGVRKRFFHESARHGLMITGDFLQTQAGVRNKVEFTKRPLGFRVGENDDGHVIVTRLEGVSPMKVSVGAKIVSFNGVDTCQLSWDETTELLEYAKLPFVIVFSAEE